MLDGRAGRGVGDVVRLGGKTFEVVGLVRGVTVWAGVSARFVTVADAQNLVFGGTSSATAIVVSAFPR